MYKCDAVSIGLHVYHVAPQNSYASEPCFTHVYGKSRSTAQYGVSKHICPSVVHQMRPFASRISFNCSSDTPP